MTFAADAAYISQESMELPPVIVRELKRRAMRSKTWWIRLGVVLFAVFAWLIPMVLGTPGLSQGKGSLFAISIFPMCVAALHGIVTTADILSQERREGTLEMLLLAPLKPAQILLQKIIATTAPVFSGLVAVFPLFALPVIIGGVSGVEAASAMVLTLATAFMSASVGCLVSAFSRSVLVASIVTFLAVTVFFGGWLVPNVAASSLIPMQMLRLLNPWDLYLRLFIQTPADVDFAELLLYLSNAGGLTVTLLAAAAIVFPKIPSRAAVRDRRRSIVALGVTVILLLGLAVALATEPLALTFLGSVAANNGFLLALVILGSCGLKLSILISVARVLNSKPWLELILTTPLCPIAYIKTELRRLAPSLVGVFLACLFFTSMVLFQLYSPFFEIGLAVLLFLLVDSLALLLVGLWNGLKYRTVNEAISFSLSTIQLIPIAVGAVCLVFGFRTATIAGGTFLWAALCLTVDLLAACSANWMLRHRLRQAAAT
jgi:ABC-type transport system involved in multi-copper enzyme maturation permease subunit